MLLRLPPNSILLTLMLFALIPTLLNWRRLPLEIKTLLLLLLCYLGMSSLVSAYPRQFYIIVPMLLVWIGYILERTLTIHWPMRRLSVPSDPPHTAAAEAKAPLR
jgi:hypothetical protein